MPAAGEGMLARWMTCGPVFQVPSSVSGDRTFIHFRWQAVYLEGVHRYIGGSAVEPILGIPEFSNYPFPWQLVQFYLLQMRNISPVSLPF